jgi:phosphatidylinositol alpha-1,6-mannosyltransferase
VNALGTYAVAPLYNKKRAFIARYIYRHADAVVAISAYTAQEIRKKVTGLPITIIDPGIDMTNFAASKNTGPRSEKGPLIIGVGTVKARKGYDTSLRAFAQLKKDIPGARYVIVGPQTDEPNYVEMLKKLAEELGVAHDFDMRANISDAELNKLYADASLFILTSVNEGFHFEGYGMVFVEAAAHGLPCVGTRGNGIEDAVEDGKTGILVTQRNVEETAAAMKRILTDPALRTRMSARALEFAREHDLPHLAEQYERLYRQVIAS